MEQNILRAVRPATTHRAQGCIIVHHQAVGPLPRRQDRITDPERPYSSGPVTSGGMTTRPTLSPRGSTINRNSPVVDRGREVRGKSVCPRADGDGERSHQGGGPSPLHRQVEGTIPVLEAQAATLLRPQAGEGPWNVRAPASLQESSPSADPPGSFEHRVAVMEVADNGQSRVEPVGPGSLRYGRAHMGGPAESVSIAKSQVVVCSRSRRSRSKARSSASRSTHRPGRPARSGAH